MKIKEFYVAILFSATLGAETNSVIDDPQYRQWLNEANAHIDNAHEGVLCPGADLALSCGNDICEEIYHEQTRCLPDCAEALIQSYDHVISCQEVEQVFEPSSIPEVQNIIQNARDLGKHVRVVGNIHSVNEITCTDGFVITTKNLNKIIGLRADSDGTSSVVVEPGVVLGDLTEWLHDRDKSLGYTVLGFRGVSIAGAIATGAHGSSPLHSSVISSLVKSVTVVTSDGKIVEINADFEDPDALRALRTNLGMLGVVVTIALHVSPQFNLHVVVSEENDSKILKDGIFKQVKDCDFALINWFPNTERFIKSCGKKTTDSVDHGANNTLLKPNVPPGLTQPFKLALHYGQCIEPLNEMLEKLRYLLFKLDPPFEKEHSRGRTVSSSDLVGYSHRMISSDFINPPTRFLQNDWEFAVPYAYAQGAIRALAKIFQENHAYMPVIGVFLRFTISQDATLLAHSTALGDFHAGEPVLFIELPTPQAIGFGPDMEELINRPFEILAHTLITKFHARGHWGKNKTWVFQQQKDIGAYGENLEKFKRVVNAFDPQAMFANQFGRDAGIY